MNDETSDEENLLPIPVYCEKDLGCEFQTLGEQLHTSEDWAVRSTALKRLQVTRNDLAPILRLRLMT